MGLFDDLLADGDGKTNATPAIATTFGYKDPEDNGVGAWGDVTNRPDVHGVSLPIAVLKQQFGDENKAHGKLVRVTNPDTGDSIVAPIVDKGPADWVVARQGNTIDLTHATNKAIGGNGKTPVTYEFVNQPQSKGGMFDDLLAENQEAAKQDQGPTQAGMFDDLLGQENQSQSQAGGVSFAPGSYNLPPMGGNSSSFGSVIPSISKLPPQQQNLQNQTQSQNYNPIENALRNFASTAATSTLNSIGGAVRYFGGAQQKDLKMAQDELAQATSSGASQDQIDEIQGRIDKFKQEIPQVQDAAKSLSDLSSQYPIAYGVNPQDRSISAQIGRGLGSATSMIPTMATGPAGMALGALQGASQAYEDTYQNAKQTLQSQGMTDESAINEQAQRQASEAAVKTAPALAAYLVGGKLASAGVSKLLSTQTPLIQGIAGTIAGSVANTAAGSTIRKIMGESAMPTPESLTQDIAFGLFHGIGTGVEAQEKLRQQQQAKAKLDAQTGGPAPQVAPSSNPVVNEREAKINAMANEQAPVPEAPKPVEVAPSVETPATEAPDKSAISNEEKLNQLFNEQWLHEEGSPEHTAIQQQIDAIRNAPKLPIEEAPAPVEEKKPEIKITSIKLLNMEERRQLEKQAQDRIDAYEDWDNNKEWNQKKLKDIKQEHQELRRKIENAEGIDKVRLQAELRDLENELRELADPNYVSPDANQILIIEKPAETSAQPTTENAVQEPSAREVGIRNTPAVGEGMGEENKPEVPTQEGQAPKEEVTTPTIETNGEGNLFKEKDLPFNLAGEELPPEPEKKTTGTEEEQQLPMGEQKPPNPYRELLHRFYHEIRTHGDFANAVQDLAKKEKNKHLQAAADKFLEEMQVGEEPNVEALLSSIEIEANDHDNPPEPTPKTKRITREIQGGYLGVDPVMAYLQENPIMSKSEYLRRVKKGEIKSGGGVYDDAPTINKGHSTQIYSTKGEPIDNAVQALVDQGLMPEGSTAADLWNRIEQSSKEAERRQAEEKAREDFEKKVIKKAQETEKLRNDNPELFEQQRNQELKDWFDSRRGRESGFTEFPRIIYDGIVEVASSLKKAGKSFADWSKDMVGKFGGGVRNYLRQIYNAISTGGGIFTERGAKRGAVDIGGDERFKPKAPTEQEAFAKKVYETSVSQRGKPPSQDEMTNILSRKFPGITSREASDLYATATGKPKPSVEDKPSFTAPESTTSEQFTTGLKKATVAQERLARGLEDIPQEERQAEEEKVARAVERVQNDPSVAPSIVSRILEEKKPAITSEDAAALLVERNQLMNERRVWERILDDENKSPAERGNAQEQVNSIETQLERLDRAQRATGSEWGRLGHLYQRMIREDYSLENMETRARRALGRPLDKSERDSIKKQSEEIQKASEELEKEQEKAQNAQEKEDIAKTYWKTIQELKAELDQRPKVEPQIKRIIDRIGVKLKEKAKASEEALARIRKEGRFNVGLDPEVLYHHAVIGADMIYEGATDIAKFTNRMVEKFGDYVLPHIKDIFAASQKEYDKTTDSEAGIKSPEVKEKAPKVEKTIGEIKATGKAEKVANPFLPGLEHLQDPLTHKLVYELARQHILEGVRGEDNVMKAVHDDIKDVYPDATERDVRRAFSEYGKAKFPSKEADRVALAELRTLTRLQESIDRLNENLPALKTGLQRNKATQDIREKTAKLNELLKKVKLPPTEEQLASRDAAKQTALKNRIADIDKQLRTGERLKRSASEPDSPETENLRLEKIAMEQLLKEVTNEAKPKKSPEEAYNERRQKAIDKKMAEIQERLRTNNYEKSPRRIPPAKNEETQRKELALKKLQNDYERKLLKYQEENKPRWAKILQGTSEAAKGLAITGYHSLEKILGFDIAKLVTTPIEEFTGSAVSMLPGMKQREGMLESGGSTIGGLIKYYKGLVKGAAEAPKVYKTGLSESEELFGKVRPNVARWYDWIGGRLHAALKHIPFTAQEELYRYRGLANAEKVAPGSSNNDLVRAAIYKAAYEKAQSAKLQEANNVADAINGYFRKLEQVDPKTGKSSVAGNVVSTIMKTFITKGIIKTPANYFKQVMRGIFGLPEGMGRLGRAYWNGIDNLTATESDAIYKAFKVGGIGFAAALYGYIDSFKDKKNRVLGGYYQSGRREGDGDAKWGTIRINGHTFHYIAHNPVTEIMQFGSTIGRVQQALMKKTDMPTAVAEGFGKSLIAMLGNAPVSGPIMRLGQPNANPIQEIAGGLVPALIANIAADTDEGAKRKPTTIKQQIEYNIPGLRQNVPLSRSGSSGRKSSSSGFGSFGGSSPRSNNPFGGF